MSHGLVAHGRLLSDAAHPRPGSDAGHHHLHLLLHIQHDAEDAHVTHGLRQGVRHGAQREPVQSDAPHVLHPGHDLLVIMATLYRRHALRVPDGPPPRRSLRPLLRLLAGPL